MKTKHFIIGLLITLIFPLSAFAINPPLVDQPPSTVNANFYTLTIYTEVGAKVTVVGGPSDLAPVTDGAGSDEEDGVVQIMVGLAQEATNTFSITAEKGGQVSSSVVITINETAGGEGEGEGDTTPPSAPVLNEIPEFVDALEYIITGESEPNANIYARRPDGSMAGSTRADDRGFFQVVVELSENKTNRINVSAEDETGNEGPATQAIIRQSEELAEPEVEEEPELITSAQMFFVDTQGHWAENYITTLYEAEVISGKTETTFDPNGNITRAELTKIAMLAFGYSVNTTVDEHPFSDVPKNAWFAPFIEEAKRLDIVEGYPSGGFGPNDFITRAATLKIILSAAGIDVSGYTPDFPDVHGKEWYASYVGYAQTNDIVGGYTDGTFGPGNFITRAQVAKIVVKILETE